MALIIWNVNAETDKKWITFTPEVSTHKLDSTEIREYIRKNCAKNSIKDPANKIYNLTLIAIDADEHFLFENLEPSIYWPFAPEEYLEYWNHFRTVIDDKKGGEK